MDLSLLPLGLGESISTIAKQDDFGIVVDDSIAGHVPERATREVNRSAAAFSKEKERSILEVSLKSPPLQTSLQ